ncbi:MAG: transporter [Alphaproteobacteria bacterium]|nr:transporter [Alphaproteobacteria bacterium]
MRLSAALPGVLALSVLTVLPAHAHDPAHHHESVDASSQRESVKGIALHGAGHEGHGRASAHAPIGVMGDHMHGKGEWMLSYRYMYMDMDGNRKGDSSIDPVTIVTMEPNRFFGMAGQPSTLRVVPTHMSMEMHMFGAMYAPADWVTLTAMAGYTEKDMDHTTFAGGAGTSVLGTFSTQSEGWGDVKLGGLFGLYDDGVNRVHLNAGISLPTGSIKESATVLAPNGMTPRLRMPYAMQPGTGTYDFLPGVTYNGHSGAWGWGAQYRAEIRLEDENDEGYAWGDKHALSVWGSYEWASWISTSARLSGTAQGDIDGIDPQIVAPVQTADPDNYGGRALDLMLGVNLLGTKGEVKGQRLAVEAGLPLYRDLNGPQMETDWTLTLGWQYAF